MVDKRIELRRKVYRNGGSFCVNIPREVVSCLSLDKGDSLSFIAKDGDIIIRKRRMP